MPVLSSSDTRILRLIEKNPRHAFALSKHVGVSRSTMRYRLERLQKHGLIRSFTRSGSNAVWWERVYTLPGKKDIIQVFSGTDFYKAYMACWKLPKGSEIHVLHGKDSFNSEFTHIPRSFIIRSQQQIRRRGIISKAICHPSLMQQIQSIEDSIVRQHAERHVMFRIIHDARRFRGTGEIIAAKNLLLIVNPERKRAVLIKDPMVASLVYESTGILFDLFESDSSIQSLNLHQFLQQELEKRGRA